MNNDHPLLRGTEHLPWSETRPGFHVKVLHGSKDDETRVLLLRLAPGTVVARHRHEGEVHAMNLMGQRKLLDTGEIIGPGGYVYEPPGNVDSWMAAGDENADDLVIFVTVRGAIEMLDEQGNVLSRTTTSSAADGYRRALEAAPRTTMV